MASMEESGTVSNADVVVEGGEAILVLITASSTQEAEKIGRHLVEERLAACANLISQVRSLFFWEGKISDANEVLLVVKSRRPLFRQLAARVHELHSYTVPEIIAVPILEGSMSYLKWVN